MSLDATKNFAIGTVSIGYDSNAVSIVLSSGHGEKFPDPASGNFNIVWWDFDAYPNPADDPNVEIVRCTAKTADTLTVTRAQEGTTATAKNTSGHFYKVALTFTAKMITDIMTEINSLNSDLSTAETNISSLSSTKAPLDSPTFTGTPVAPTASLGTNTTQIATTAFVKAALEALIDSSPGALDTLNELAAALGDDADFATTVTNALALKAPLDSPTFTGTPSLPTGTTAVLQSTGDSSTKVATTSFVQQEKMGYVLTCYSPGSSSTSIVASQTYYFGNFFNANLTTSSSGNRKIYFPKSGKIKRIDVCSSLVAGATSSGENASLYLRITGSTDQLIADDLSYSASGTYFRYVSGLSIDVVGGTDYIEFKLVTPAWSSNPFQPSFYATVYIE